MTQLKSMVFGGLFTLIIFATVALAIVVASEAQAVQADEVSRVTDYQAVEYAQLTDAVPQRDVTLQYFAPLAR